MKKKLFISLALLLDIAAFAVIPAVAQAEPQTLVSKETNSLCVNPTPTRGFKPTINGRPNYAPLTRSHKRPFNDTGNACAPETPTHAIAMGGPGEPAGPFTGSLFGASWVSINSTGEDGSNPAPRYYIYDETFSVPCGNQAEGAQMGIKLFADNAAGVFLNGMPIGHQPFGPAANGDENYDSSPGHPDGWSFTSGVGAAAGFRTGENSLQFVVLDESGPDTALDFSATITSPDCLPHWYSNGKLIQEGEVVPITISGVLTFQIHETTTKCKVEGQETITNPVGGGAGTDEVTDFTLKRCGGKPSPCPRGTATEVRANNLPWPTHLIPGPTILPATNVVEGSAMEIRCSGQSIGIFTGAHLDTAGRCNLARYLHEPGDSVFELCGIKQEELTITGVEKVKGPEGDEKITAH